LHELPGAKTHKILKLKPPPLRNLPFSQSKHKHDQYNKPPGAYFRELSSNTNYTFLVIL